MLFELELLFAVFWLLAYGINRGGGGGGGGSIRLFVACTTGTFFVFTGWTIGALYDWLLVPEEEEDPEGWFKTWDNLGGGAKPVLDYEGENEGGGGGGGRPKVGSDGRLFKLGGGGGGGKLREGSPPVFELPPPPPFLLFMFISNNFLAFANYCELPLIYYLGGSLVYYVAPEPPPCFC